jgi:glycosyltransferase involved in cell wall biosynthesis
MKRTLLLADANSNHTRKWILLLQKHNHLVALFSLYPPNDDWFKIHQVECHSFFKNNTLSSLKKMRYPWAYFQAKKLLTSFQPDIVNAHYATSYGLLGAILKPKKLIVNFWGSDVFVFPKKSFLHARILRFIIAKAHTICSSSLVMSNEIKRYTSREIVVIPFGINTDEYPKKANPIEISKNRTIVLGIVKTLEPVYRIDVAINAVRLLNSTFDYKFVLHIAGAGSLEAELKNLASEDVVFHGKLNQNDVPAFLYSLDFFLNTSEFESFGVSTIEAMACGIPVIAHNAGGSAEIISVRKTGFLYQPNIPEELASTIFDIVENKNVLPAIVDEAYQMILEKYSIKQPMKLLEEHF